MTDHHVTFEFNEGMVSPRFFCTAPEGSDCRLVGMDNCHCESWTIERAHEGAAPYHQVDTVGGAEILHWMKDGGECNAATFINEGDPMEGHGRFTIGTVPVETVWEGEWYTWKHVETPTTDQGVKVLAEYMFQTENGETISEHRKNCNLPDCTLPTSYFEEAALYAAKIKEGQSNG